jgi:hypothetical protein
MIKFLLLISSLGHPVRIKFVPSVAFSIACRRSMAIILTRQELGHAPSGKPCRTQGEEMLRRVP